MKIDDIISFQCWFAAQRFYGLSKGMKFRHLLAVSLKILFLEAKIKDMEELHVQEKNKVLFFKSLIRKDYDKLFLNVVQEWDGPKHVVELDGYQIINLRSDLFQRVSFRETCLRLVFMVYQTICRGKIWWSAIRGHGLFTGSWLWLQTLQFMMISKKILRCKPRAVVVFAEMQDFDRVLTWQCRLRGIPCATLQHGLYAEYTKTETVNKFNYQPAFVDRFLAWGEDTAQLVRAYRPQVEVSVCGKPAQIEVPVIKQDSPKYACILIMDQNIFEKQNREMIEIVNEVFAGGDLNIGIRFHPQNVAKTYDVKGLEVLPAGDWPIAECYIGHTTSLLVDLLHAGVRIFRYRTICESILQEPEIEFENSEGLRNLLEKPMPDISATLNRYIACSGKSAIQKHIAAIHAMLHDPTGI